STRMIGQDKGRVRKRRHFKARGSQAVPHAIDALKAQARHRQPPGRGSANTTRAPGMSPSPSRQLDTCPYPPSPQATAPCLERVPGGPRCPCSHSRSRTDASWHGHIYPNIHGGQHQGTNTQNSYRSFVHASLH
ncbi:hypothetical protein C2E23DRAFT_819831, partial [Lenzites betulinus]